MFGIINFGAFVAAGILLNITPGTDTIYILSRSISNGKKSGYLSTLGISTGSLIHTLLAAFGLSILLSESEMAFNIVKYLGAAYLIYLGIKALLSKTNDLTFKEDLKAESNWMVFLSGALTNVLNPKVALFYLAFLPQFIDPLYPNSFISFLILGCTFTISGSIWCIILATFSSKLSEKIRNNSNAKVWLDRITGTIFISLGIKLALSKLK